MSKTMFWSIEIWISGLSQCIECWELGRSRCCDVNEDNEFILELPIISESASPKFIGEGFSAPLSEADEDKRLFIPPPQNCRALHTQLLSRAFSSAPSRSSSLLNTWFRVAKEAFSCSSSLTRPIISSCSSFLRFRYRTAAALLRSRMVDRRSSGGSSAVRERLPRPPRVELTSLLLPPLLD